MFMPADGGTTPTNEVGLNSSTGALSRWLPDPMPVTAWNAQS